MISGFTRIAAVVLMLGLAGGAAAQNNKPSVALAEVNLDQGTLLIYGQGFTANNKPTVVTLSGATLTLQTVQSSFIVALLPSGLVPGSYRLTVSAGIGTSQSDAFEITIGAVGATGAEGPEGAPGPAGIQGDPGPQGEPGPQGATGETGAQGAVGPQGATGATGPAGTDGTNGTNGTNGATGATGAQGPMGLTGAQGPAGPAGPQGPAGPEGPAGTAGSGIQASVHMNFASIERSGWAHVESLGDDTCSPSIPLGFTFNGFGASVSEMKVSSNGVLFFGDLCSTAFINGALPSFITSNPALFFFWDDLYDYGGGEYYEYTTMGSAPHRVFSMYFRNRLLSSACGSAAMIAMISIHEASNLVNVSYENINSCAQMRGSAATFGIQSAAGAESVPVSFNVPILDYTAARQFMSFRPQ